VIFRRLRSAPPKFIAFRVACFVVGLGYVLLTTETAQVARTAVDLAKAIAASVEGQFLSQQIQPEKAGTSND
jgi:hypothetical protein